jgi:outer membrane protein
MNKLLSSVIVSSLLFISSGYSAVLLGVGAEIDYFQPEISGYYQSDDKGTVTRSDFTGEKKSFTQAGIYFEHFVPIIPNLRIDYSEVDLTANSTILTSKSSLKTGKSFSNVKLRNVDIIPYYEFLDNAISLDIGIVLRGIESDYKTTDIIGGTSIDNSKFFVPMGYIAGEVSLPMLPIKANVEFKYIKIKDSLMSDAKFRATYKLPLGFGAEVGYRVQKLKIDDFGIKSDVTFKGPFAGVSYNF